MALEVKATIIGNRIAVKSSYEDKDLCKSVLGARWSRKDSAWTYPATVDTCHALRRVFGPRLRVLNALAEWYQAAAESAAEQATRAIAADAELEVLPRVAPRLAATLRPDQRAGVAAIAAGHLGGIIVADKPGLGKTMQVIGGILEAEIAGPVLVVCPKVSVKSVWWRELVRWTDESVHIARGTRRNREKALAEFQADPSKRKWLIVVAEMLRVDETPDERDPAGKRKKFSGYQYEELFQELWAAVVVDESHKVLGSLTVTKGNLMGKGFKRLDVLPAELGGRKIAISGTPFGRGGRIQGMFGTLHWIWPKEFTSFWRWAEAHFEVEDVYIGRGKTAKKIGSLRGGVDGEAFLQALGPRILRRTKEEVLKHLPPKQYVRVWCEMEATQLRQYQELTVDAEVVTEDGVLSTNGVLAELTRAKQIANGVVTYDGEEVRFTGESCKIEALMQKLEDRGITGGSNDGGDTKVIVASQFNQFLLAVADRLQQKGIPFFTLTGATKDADREVQMEAWQSKYSEVPYLGRARTCYHCGCRKGMFHLTDCDSPEALAGAPRVFLLNAKAGGVSITLDAADELHALDELWNPEDMEQLEDRIHRASRIHQVTIFQYTTEGTVDERIAEDVEQKRLEQFKVLDGRRGLDYVRELVEYRAPKPDNENARVVP